jgi:NADH-quinone oxidoreductase subunit J
MTELWLFIIVGALAVASAVLMLLSENAVHSALFLIVTMVCIAFLFLMLNSPFLALIQITVYAGAIMVLFLFVIMLLGAERLQMADMGPDKARFRWFTPVALTLALALLFSIGLVTIQGNIDQQPVPQADPQVRVVNTANAGPVDVYVGSLLLADDLAFGQASEFASVPAGEYQVSVRPASGGESTATLQAEPDGVTSLVAYGTEALPQVALVSQSLAATERDGDTRVLVFNGVADVAQLEVAESSSFDTITDAYLRPVAGGIALGEAAALERRAGEVSWDFYAAGAPTQRLAQLDEHGFGINRSALLVLTQEVLTTGGIRTAPLVFDAPAQAVYGSPHSIGYSLFTTFLLPFQVLGLLLLAAMVGVIVLTHRELAPVKKVQARRRVSKSLTNVIAAQVGHEVVDEAPRLPQPAPEKPTEPEPVN